MERIKTEKAPVSLIVDHKDAPPTSSEDSIERALRLYLDKATVEERKVLEDEDLRERVSEQLRPVLPVLERVSEVTELESGRLGLEGLESIMDTHIALACRNVVLEEENRIQAIELRTDELTGLGNRRAYREDVQKAMEEAVEKKQALWLFAIDLDGLKRINDENGHEAGDQVIQEVSKRFERAVRRADNIYRPGGDEYLVLAGPDNEEGAKIIAERLLSEVNSRPVIVETMYGPIEIPASVSIGVSQFKGDDASEVSKKQMERDADIDLYHAKRMGGRNCAYLEGRNISETPTGVHSTLPPDMSTARLSEPAPRSRPSLAIVRSS